MSGGRLHGKNMRDGLVNSQTKVAVMVTVSVAAAEAAAAVVRWRWTTRDFSSACFATYSRRLTLFTALIASNIYLLRPRRRDTVARASNYRAARALLIPRRVPSLARSHTHAAGGGE